MDAVLDQLGRARGPADGYVYCFANPSMPGILKVGATERTPEDRLREANAADTWRPPTPYRIEFAKKVADPTGDTACASGGVHRARPPPARVLSSLAGGSLQVL